MAYVIHTVVHQACSLLRAFRSIRDADNVPRISNSILQTFTSCLHLHANTRVVCRVLICVRTALAFRLKGRSGLTVNTHLLQTLLQVPLIYFSSELFIMGQEAAYDVYAVAHGLSIVHSINEVVVCALAG